VEQKDHPTEDGVVNGGSRGTELAVATAAGLAGGIMSLFPHLQIAGVVVSGFSGVFGVAAGKVRCAWDGIQAGRVEQFGNDVRERLEAEGLVEELPNLEDIITEAIPIVANAHQEAKRRLLVEVIVNGARHPDIAARTEASMALRLIEAMTPEAIVVFGGLVARRRSGTLSAHEVFKFTVGDECFGMKWEVMEAGLRSLEELRIIVGDLRFSLKETGKVRAIGEVEIRLGHQALLLARWIEESTNTTDG